jgi:hypothetical protein
MPDAGPGLDALVAEALGITAVHDARIVWTYGASTNDGVALRALEAWLEKHEGVSARLDMVTATRIYVATIHTRILWVDGDLVPKTLAQAEAPTLALAICRAIVQAGREARE